MKEINVLPNWWSFTFIGLQAASLVPLTLQNLLNPVGTFMEVIPAGYDKATDGIVSSARIELAGTTNAQSYPMIGALLVGCVLFARNSLRGQPKLQQRLVNLAVYVALASDIWLYATFATKLPAEVLWHTALWTPTIKGIAYGLPVATALKLLWVFGLGRDVV